MSTPPLLAEFIDIEAGYNVVCAVRGGGGGSPYGESEVTSDVANVGGSLGRVLGAAQRLTSFVSN